MKAFNSKKPLVMLFAGLLTVSGAVLAELGPPEGKGEKGTQAGDLDRKRTGECKEVLGVTVEGDGTQDRIRQRDGSCGDGPGPNQNPDPGFGDKQHNK